MNYRIRKNLWLIIIYCGILIISGCSGTDEIKKPNIIWLLTEDISPHFKSYNVDDVPSTPNIQNLARDGVLFTRAYVTAPVCSPSRSALITGDYQFSLGVHNHRSQRKEGKGGVRSTKYHGSYYLKNPVIPELMNEAGYRVINVGHGGKKDYNFLLKEEIYQEDWPDKNAEKPFFMQIQLIGGKKRGQDILKDSSKYYGSIPPYYPEDKVYKDDWIDYLNSLQYLDKRVGSIMARLKENYDLNNTIIFFFSDHGVSHLRGKQFLYEEGIKIPLIVNFPEKYDKKGIRNDLVKHIDIGATTLKLAGLDIPDYIEGRDIFDKNSGAQDFIFSGRDRCDETVDFIRSIASDTLKYIVNFYPYRAHLQHNQYKNRKGITKRLRVLHATNKLGEWEEDNYFKTPRPLEELYNLKKDQYEMTNLANDPSYSNVLLKYREQLIQKMNRTKDLGFIPEPLLEEYGVEYGHKSRILKNKNKEYFQKLFKLHLHGSKEEVERLEKYLLIDDPVIRYWALTYLGNIGDSSILDKIRPLLREEVESVRIAASIAYIKISKSPKASDVLIQSLKSENPLARLYAILGIEQVKNHIDLKEENIEFTLNDNYNFVRRVARRLFKDKENMDGTSN